MNFSLKSVGEVFATAIGLFRTGCTLVVARDPAFVCPPCKEGSGSIESKDALYVSPELLRIRDRMQKLEQREAAELEKLGAQVVVSGSLDRLS